MKTLNNDAPTRFHCVRCGATWGAGKDVKSSGLCIKCVAEWVIQKQQSEGNSPCFGVDSYVDKDHCRFEKFCKEYYGFRQELRQNLLR
jgi:hypothetical protein